MVIEEHKVMVDFIIDQMTKQHNEMLNMTFVQENRLYHCILVSSLLNFVLIIILIPFVNHYYHKEPSTEPHEPPYKYNSVLPK